MNSQNNFVVENCFRALAFFASFSTNAMELECHPPPKSFRGIDFPIQMSISLRYPNGLLFPAASR